MKSINQAGIDALNAGHVDLLLAFEMQIDDDVMIRVHSGTGDKTIDGEVYGGVGSLGTVSPVSVKGDAKPTGIQVELTGIDPTLLAGVMSYHYQGRPASLKVVILDTNDYSIIDVHTIFVGKVDTMSIKSGATGVVSIAIENRLVDWMRSDNSRFTQGDYERDTGATDGFYAFVNSVVSKQIEFTPYQSWNKQ